jgi:hypothetical protein
MDYIWYTAEYFDPKIQANMRRRGVKKSTCGRATTAADPRPILMAPVRFLSLLLLVVQLVGATSR